MTNFKLEYPREETKQVVKGAFEATDAIDEYHDGGTNIVGLSRSTFKNYAEWVRVEIPRQPGSNGRTTVRVPPEDPLSETSTPQPNCCKQELLEHLDEIRDSDDPLELVGSD